MTGPEGGIHYLSTFYSAGDEAVIDHGMLMWRAPLRGAGSDTVVSWMGGNPTVINGDGDSVRGGAVGGL